MMRWMKILLLGLMLLSVVACRSIVDIKEVRAAAEDGVAQAQYELGMRYVLGEKGACLDYEAAAYWFRKAAEQGFAQAQATLGGCYLDGKGVNKDFKQAVYWWRKAAEQGHVQAQNLLGFYYYNGFGVPRDYE
jgi:TPR repeat protein